VPDIVTRECTMADVDDFFHMHMAWAGELMYQMGALLLTYLAILTRRHYHLLAHSHARRGRV
jgi:hypothetical protein